MTEYLQLRFENAANTAKDRLLGQEINNYQGRLVYVRTESAWELSIYASGLLITKAASVHSRSSTSWANSNQATRDRFVLKKRKGKVQSPP
jgi:hypothetical protein